MNAVKKKIRATENVAKLTNVMKLVASSKLKSAEQNLERAKPFGQSLMNSVALTQDKMEEMVKSDAEESQERQRKKQLLLILTTDRGLCGSVNSTIARMIPAYLKEQQDKGFDPSVRSTIDASLYVYSLPYYRYIFVGVAAVCLG